MSLFEKIKNKTLVEKKSDSDYFAKDKLGNVYKTEKDYDNRPFSNYEKDQAKKANTTPQELRKRFKKAKFDGPPFARQTRNFDTQYTKPDGTKRVSPSFFDKRQEFGIKDDGKVDIKIYTLKIVYDKATGEILHLSESMDSDGEVTFTIDGEILVVYDLGVYL